MKLTDLLTDVGRPVAYYPRLRELTGSTNATILLCQLLYWTGKEKGKDGWIFKRAQIVEDDPEGKEAPTNQSIEWETGLSYKEQIAARRLLRKSGLLTERYARTEHLLYFQLNLEKINGAWEHLTDGHMPKGKQPHDQRSPGTLPSVISLSTSETTAQKTTEITDGEDLALANRISELNKLCADELTRPSRIRLLSMARAYPSAWYRPAFRAMVERGVRKLAYVEAVLKDWSKNGFPIEDAPGAVSAGSFTPASQSAASSP